MSKDRDLRMGRDPLAWINQDQPADQTEQKKIGRPRTIYREYEKSSQENLPENWTRATFIVREDRLRKLKDYAYTDRRTLKDVVNEMIDLYLDGKEIIEREDE
jgi:hypothetical protein